MLILGKWGEVNSTDRVEFIRDGTVVSVSQGLFGPNEQHGTYEFLDDDSVRIQFTGLFAPEVSIYTASFQSNRMRLATTGGGVTEYIRID